MDSYERQTRAANAAAVVAFLRKQDLHTPKPRSVLHAQFYEETGVSVSRHEFTQAATAAGYGRTVRRHEGKNAVHLGLGPTSPSLVRSAKGYRDKHCPYCKGRTFAGKGLSARDILKALDDPKEADKLRRHLERYP